MLVLLLVLQSLPPLFQKFVNIFVDEAISLCLDANNADGALIRDIIEIATGVHIHIVSVRTFWTTLNIILLLRPLLGGLDPWSKLLLWYSLLKLILLL